MDVVDPPVTLVRKAMIDVFKALPIENLQGFPFAPSGATGTPLIFLMDPSDTNEGTDEQIVIVSLKGVILVQANDDAEGQKAIDSFIVGPLSIRETIKRNRDLNGTCLAAKVISGKSLNKVQIADYQVWGYEFDINVWMKA